MIINNVTRKFRNIFPYKVFAAINLVGLSFGIVASMFLFMVVRYQMSHDGFRSPSDQVYHMARQDKTKDRMEMNMQK